MFTDLLYTNAPYIIYIILYLSCSTVWIAKELHIAPFGTRQIKPDVKRSLMTATRVGVTKCYGSNFDLPSISEADCYCWGKVGHNVKRKRRLDELWWAAVNGGQARIGGQESFAMCLIWLTVNNLTWFHDSDLPEAPGWDVLMQPPYSPDLTPSEYYEWLCWCKHDPREVY